MFAILRFAGEVQTVDLAGQKREFLARHLTRTQFVDAHRSGGEPLLERFSLRVNRIDLRRGLRDALVTEKLRVPFLALEVLAPLGFARG